MVRPGLEVCPFKPGCFGIHTFSLPFNRFQPVSFRFNSFHSLHFFSGCDTLPAKVRSVFLWAISIFPPDPLRNLSGVHPNLIAVVGLALSESIVDFTVVEGLRDIETQRQNVAKGVSQTMNSRHLKQDDGFGHAVDLYPYFDGSVQVEAPEEAFQGIAYAMQSAANTLGIRITWGGSWKSFVDMPHFQYEGVK